MNENTSACSQLLSLTHMSLSLNVALVTAVITDGFLAYKQFIALMLTVKIDILPL